MQPQRAPFWGACLASLFSAAAWADRPLVSETADVIDADACQLESSLGRGRSSGQPAVRSADALFSCGTAFSTQWALGIDGARSAGQTASDLLLGGKTTLVMPKDGSNGWGVAYSATALRESGKALRLDSFTLLGVFTREFTSGWLGHANLGWSHSRVGHEQSTVWSLGVESTANPTLAADAFGDDRSRPWLSAGAGYSLTERFSINAALAQQFDTPRLRQWSLGLKLSF